MKKLLITLMLAGASLASTANDKLNYTYAQFGLAHSEGLLTSDKSGYNFDISTSWTDSVYLHLTYDEQSADVWAAGLQEKVSAKQYALAVGYHTSITRSSDLFAELGYLKQDAENIIPQTTYGNDEDGFFTKVGLRSRFSSSFEYSIFAAYQDVDTSNYIDLANYEDENDTLFGIEGRYYLSTKWSLGLTLAEEATGLTSRLNIRFNLK